MLRRVPLAFPGTLDHQDDVVDPSDGGNEFVVASVQFPRERSICEERALDGRGMYHLSKETRE
jgi:hypothetical protein